MRLPNLCLGISLLVVAAPGCGGSGASSTRNLLNPPASGGGTGGGGAGASIEVTTVAGLPPTYPIKFDVTDAPVQVVNVRAIGADFTVKALTIQASGTIDDAADVAGVKVAADDGDGVFDRTRDAFVGGIARFSGDDGAAIVGGINRTVPAGTTELWWIVYDLAGTAEPGETLAAAIQRESDVDALDGAGQRAIVTGVPARSPQGIVFQGEHLMLSEVCVTPTDGEFVEIFNPTSQTIDLSSFYMTDAEANTTTALAHYYNLPTGQNFGKWDANDFHVRFPAGATIRPGEFLTIAVDGDKFKGQYGKDASFEMVQDGAGDGVPDMRIVGPVPQVWTAGLSNGAEVIVLYTWDGNADLVRDVDLVQWGSNVTAFFVRKTGLSVDGPDPDSTASVYRADSEMIMQDKAQANDIGTSMKRLDFSEYGENAASGNGVTGHDETSENFGITWSNMTSPTPGAK